MSTPEIDERFDDLVRELRTLPGAPDELRARVRGLTEAAPPVAPRRRRTRRLVLVAACLVLLGVAGVAAVYGIVSTDTHAWGSPRLHPGTNPPARLSPP